MKLHPFLPISLAGARVNQTLHGNSVYRSKSVPGHNVFHKGSDGLDVFVPAGTEVYACCAGRVINIAGKGGKLERIEYSGTVEGVVVTILVAHISVKPALHIGANLEAGQVIGYVGRKIKDPHPHIECKRDGKPLAGETPRELRERWERIVEP